MTTLRLLAVIVFLAGLPGCDMQGPAAMPTGRSPFAEGVYTLSAVAQCTGIENGGAPLSYPPVPSLQISANGLPVIDGKEVRIGGSVGGEVANFQLTVTTRSIGVSSNGIVLMNDVLYDVDPPGSDAGDLSGVSNVTLTAIEGGSIRYQLYMVVGDDHGNSLVLTCDATYTL